MNKNIYIGLSGTLLAASCAKEKQVQTERPNVIIIYTDDQGSIDLNCYGATDLQTPNMDKLAEKGVRFTRFYAASPVSSPSRAALLTGKSPEKVGLPDNAASQKGGHKGLPGSVTTIAEAMKQGGYTTAHIGKWHVGYADTNLPNAQGFDHSFGHMGGCIDNYSHYFYWSGPNVHDLYRNGQEIWHDGKYFPELMVKEAKSFIDNNTDKPFFMYYAINMPHYPLQGTKKWREYYKDYESPRKEYATFLSSMDENIGELYTHLENKGMLENTIIILQADQGHSTEIRTFGGGGNSGPYRGCKFSVFEGGIRVPALISWPAKIPQGEVRNQMAINMDWFPTILDLCGIQYNDPKLEGKSIKSVIIDNTPTPHESLVLKYAHQWVVMKGDYKMMYKPIDPTINPDKFWWPVCDSLYLVNINEDPGETTNLFPQESQTAGELKQIYDSWISNK